MPKQSERAPNNDNLFTLPGAVKREAVSLTRSGVRISVTPAEFALQMTMVDGALNRGSNDAEHDALVEIRDWLSDMYEDPTRRVKPGVKLS